MLDKAIGSALRIVESMQFKNVRQTKTNKAYTCSELMLPASDGTKLHTFIFRPDTGNEKVPCIVERTGYSILFWGSNGTGKEYCKRGYAYVMQASRGVGGSEGTWKPNVNERQDGLDLLEYLCSLEWVGNIGYQGLSYMALCGWAMADALPDKVKSMYLDSYGCDRFTSAYSNGLFRHDVLTSWTMQNAGFKIKSNYLDSCKYRPHIEVDEAMWGHRVDWYRDLISNPDRSDEYWSEGFWKMLKDIPTKVKIPIFYNEGWFDHHLASSLRTYELLPQTVKEHSVLQIGPWNHMGEIAIDGYKGYTKHGASKRTQDKLDWFEKTLKNSELPKADIRYYHVGADEWRHTDSYPYISKGDCRYVFVVKDGTKQLQRGEQGKGSVGFVFDPTNPVPSVGSESMLKTGKQRGSKLQPKPDYRQDIVSFISEPLEEALDFTGRIKVNLHVASSAEDTAFCAKVIEVMPNGKAYNIRTLVGTLAFREGEDSRVDYTPGKYVDLLLESWDVSWRLQKGSRLRIDVTSSDFPQYAVHSNKKGLWCTVRESIKAKQEINCEKSFVLLPQC